MGDGKDSISLMTEIARLETENRVLREGLGLRGLGEGAIDKLEAADRDWMTRDDLLAHFECAMVCWDATLDEVIELRAKLKGMTDG